MPPYRIGRLVIMLAVASGCASSAPRFVRPGANLVGQSSAPQGCIPADAAFTNNFPGFDAGFDLTKDAVVDATSFRQCGKSRGYAVRDSMRVVVINMNPFLFQYTVTVKSFVVVETAPAFFFQSILGTDFSALAKALTSALPAPPSAPKAMEFCAAGNTMYAELLQQDTALTDQLNGADSAARTFETAYSAQQKIMTARRATMTEIVPAATAADSLDRRFATTMDAAVTAIVAFTDAATKYLQLGCGPNGWAVAQEIVRLQARLATVRAAADAARTDAGQLETVLREPLNFYRILSLGPHVSSSRDSVTVARRAIPVVIPPGGAAAGKAAGGKTDGQSPKASGTADTGSPYVTIATTVVEFGPRKMFTIGAGMTVGDIPVRSFVSVRRYQASLAPADTVVTVIGVAQNDSYRFAPMLTLNWQFWDGHVRGWSSDLFSGVSTVLGATVNKGSQTNLEYYGGLAINWFDNRVTVGAGYYAAQEIFLARGDSIGQRIPNTQAPPTTTKLTLRPAAQLGFRIYQ